VPLRPKTGLFVSIHPTPADIGRAVRIIPSGSPPILGALRSVHEADDVRDKPYAMVKFDDIGFPVATYLDKLDWHEETLL
jgi:hypothetical protein